MSLRSRPSNPGTTICSAGSRSWSAPRDRGLHPWLALGLLLLAGLTLLRRPWASCSGWRCALCGAGRPGPVQPGRPLIGVSLGVNPVNALVLGVLGAPGFGLLLMLQWALR